MISMAVVGYDFQESLKKEENNEFISEFTMQDHWHFLMQYAAQLKAKDLC